MGLIKRLWAERNSPSNGSGEKLLIDQVGGEHFGQDHLQASSTYLVDLRRVYKVYEIGTGRFTALRGVNLQVNAGEFVAVVGKSGSGKSTLMNMVTGIDRPTKGEVYIDDVAIHRLSEGEMAEFRGRKLGIVFQFFQLLPTLTVIENIMLPMDFCHMYSLRERKERALSLLELVDLADQAYKLPSALSGGQQQRVAIARALANDPPIMVADEPTGNLDTKTAEAVFELFSMLVNDGKTIITVTHDLDLANKVSRTIHISDGRIAQDTLNGEVAEPGILDEDQAEAVLDRALDDWRLQISLILDDPENAVELLRKEFDSLVTDVQLSEQVFMIVVDEVNQRVAQATEEGDPEQARLYWEILAQATN